MESSLSAERWEFLLNFFDRDQELIKIYKGKESIFYYIFTKKTKWCTILDFLSS